MIGAAMQPSHAPVLMWFPAEPDSLTIVRQALTGIAEVLGLSEARIDDLKVAVTEACANVVMHAYEGNGPGSIEVMAREEGRELVVTVTDTGGGIVPRAERVSPGLGLGLQMIAALSDDMSISTNDGGVGTVVRMVFRLP